MTFFKELRGSHCSYPGTFIPQAWNALPKGVHKVPPVMYVEINPANLQVLIYPDHPPLLVKNFLKSCNSCCNSKLMAMQGLLAISWSVFRITVPGAIV